MTAEWLYLTQEKRVATALTRGWVAAGLRYALLVPVLLSHVVAQGTSAQPFIYFQF